MRVILREDVHQLGRSGEIVTVKDGFARNYLLPRKIAVPANEKNVRQIEHDKAVISARQAKLKGSAEEQAGKLQTLSLKIARKVGQQDKLYGSVTALDIAEVLSAQGQKVERRSIDLHAPIMSLGVHQDQLLQNQDRISIGSVEVVPD